MRSVITAVLAFMFAGCAHVRVDSNVTNAPPGVTLRVLAMRPAERGIDVDFELRNDSAAPFRYFGWSPAEPIYRVEFRTAISWAEQPLLLCANGVTTQSLSPGERVVITRTVYARNRLQRVRIGITAADAHTVAWTPLLDLATLSAGPAIRSRS